MSSNNELETEVKFLPAGTSIVFEGATEAKFGALTVVQGVLDITYYDGSTALVKMGKFPVLKAKLLVDSYIMIDKTELNVLIDSSIEKSRSKHKKWYEKSCWFEGEY
ncbi:hypothetical protein [Photobacterium sp.]|uniref:hypothetical protein n=1 Tax=Photobacterium sp. TaxID=660 RepID=UPI00299F16E1|nr:hypothetical protein [Photobacterium sp.]MDX1300912.1 hypothetical protein [Photobacterium sp.]